ncbi:hypothetical protein [Pseudomonas oryzae]|nr:hypothetical protein [Pseudomonas oryzae]
MERRGRRCLPVGCRSGGSRCACCTVNIAAGQ